MKKRNKKLSERQHILIRSGMYLGSKTLTESEQYIIEDGKFVLKTIKHVPGLVKLCNELVDNSVDVFTDSDVEFKSRNISVEMDNKYFSVLDNGTGIPVEMSEDEHGNEFLEPELCWTHARAGSNFEEDEEENESATIGTNGVGSMIASVFSKSFVGISDDGKKRCTVSCSENNLNINSKVTKSIKQGVKVTIEPDVERFGLEEITQIHIDMIEQRMYSLSVAYPKITFKFNGKIIRLNAKKYIQMFGDDVEMVSTPKYTIAYFPNSSDDFKQFTLLNGLFVTGGGNHVTLINNQAIYRVRQKLIKNRMYKDIKPGDIRNKLFMVCLMNDFEGAEWEGQVKDELASSTSKITNYFGDINWDKFAASLLRNDKIMDPITENYKLKEQLKANLELKAADKKTKKKPKSEKFIPPIGNWDNCFLCEGDCLSEDTEILLSNNTRVKIKDINPGDFVIQSDGSIQKVKSRVNLLRDSITIKTQTSEIICSKKHRLYVYDTSDNSFKFIEAAQMLSNISRYKLLKSKLNSVCLYEVIENSNMKITTGLIDIDYTMNDFFIVYSDAHDKYMRVHATEITAGDLIIQQK